MKIMGRLAVELFECYFQQLYLRNATYVRKLTQMQVDDTKWFWQLTAKQKKDMKMVSLRSLL